MDKCKNHPLRFAAGRCKRCHMPLCMECKIAVEEGIFCSDECVEQFRSFQSRISTMGGTRSGFSFFAWLKNTALSVLLLAFIYVVLAFWLGTTDPMTMFAKLKDILGQLL